MKLFHIVVETKEGLVNTVNQRRDHRYESLVSIGVYLPMRRGFQANSQAAALLSRELYFVHYFYKIVPVTQVKYFLLHTGFYRYIGQCVPYQHLAL